MKKLFFFPIALLLLLMNSCGNPEGQTTVPAIQEPVILRPTKASPEAITTAIAEIKSNPEWIASLEKDALDKKMPLDSLLFTHGSFIVLQNPSKYGLVKYPEEQIAARVAIIKSTPEWLASVQKEAAQKGKPEDEWIREVALYMLDKELQ